jgi:ribosomal protein L37AE/L43A
MMVVDQRTCPKCPSRLLIGGTIDRPFWVCPACHMAFLSPALMGHAEAPLLLPS